MGEERRLVLGTAQFGLDYGVSNASGKVPRDEVRRILEYARSCGMDTLDTAAAYGDSEIRLGEIGVRSWTVLSKVPAVPESATDIVEWVTSAVRNSLQRLQLTTLPGLLLHHPRQLMTERGQVIYEALQSLKEQGLVGRIGISVYGPEELSALTARFSFDLAQAPLNVLDRRMVSSGWIERAEATGIDLHLRSVFLQGLLLLRPDALPAGFEAHRPLWSAWRAWLEQTGITPVQACVRFALQASGSAGIVIGVTDRWQLDEIIEAANAPAIEDIPEWPIDDSALLNPSLWPRIDRAAASRQHGC